MNKWVTKGIVVPILWLIQDKQKEDEKEQSAEDASSELAQEVFSQLKSQGIDLPEDVDATELEQKFKEVDCEFTYI